MNKKIAFDNRLCYERDVLRQHALHQQKLQTMLPTCHSPSKVYLDSNAPPPRTHLATNRKKQQLEKERQTAIYAQNQRLAAKMEHILHRQENVVLAAGTPHTGIASSAAGGPTSPRAGGAVPSPKKPLVKPVHSPAYVHMPGIRLNASQTPMVDCYLSPEFAMGRGNACKKTTLINRGVQKQRQQQIDDENRRLQARLQAQKPYYNTKKWDADWQHTGTKFQHLHQDATVGHLLPRTSHGTRTSPRSPLAARHVKTRDGLPSLKPTTSHGPPTSPPSRGGCLQQRLEAKNAPPPRHAADVLTIHHHEDTDIDDDENDDDDDAPEIVACGAFVLLEATTRKGVEISIDELQIEMHDAASGCVQLGDRGLLVRGRWRGDVEAECAVALDVLTRLAQELDDLEMMIKLETVSTLADGAGNFPRLSTLLTEDELQRLLLKLVQVLNVQLSDDETQLVITSRLLRAPSPLGKDDKARVACRPRTCPSSLPSDTHTAFDFDGDAEADAEADAEGNALDDVTDEETQQYHRVLCKQLEVLVNSGARRAGFRLRSHTGFYLVQFWLHAQAVELQVTVASVRDDVATQTLAMPLDSDQIIALLEQIQHHSTTPTEAVRQFIRAWLTTSVL